MKNSKTKHNPPRREKKGVVIYAGLAKDGGSISDVKEKLSCTKNNVVKHIRQCEDWYGFVVSIDGDRFKITGEIPAHWGW